MLAVTRFCHENVWPTRNLIDVIVDDDVAVANYTDELFA